MEHVQKRLGLKFHLIEDEGSEPLCGMRLSEGWQMLIDSHESRECKNCLRVKGLRDGKTEGEEEK